MKTTKYLSLALLTLLALLAPASAAAHNNGIPHDEPHAQTAQGADTLTTYLIVAGVVAGVCGVAGFLIQRDTKE